MTRKMIQWTMWWVTAGETSYHGYSLSSVLINEVSEETSYHGYSLSIVTVCPVS